MTESILHIGTDRTGRTWRVMDRDDSFSVYYTNDGDSAHHVIYDSLDEWRDPPRVLLGRAEQAERRVRELERRLNDARNWIRSEGERANVCTFNVLGEICGSCRCERRNV